MIECPSCGFSNVDKAQQCGKCTFPLLGSDLRCGLYTYGGTSNGQVLQMRYIITRELSSDFTGVKYLAEDVKEKKDVMIWALPIIVGEDEGEISSLCELCNSLKGLTDEHILNVSGFYPEKNARYVVAEYVDGCTLEQRIASEGPLNIEQALEIFGPIAQSLDIAHRQGFIHGDIGPDNILISSEGIAKLANFAIGKEIKEMLSRLLPEEVIKPSFCTAPEQLENVTCSEQSDIYSLAACIYQSLCKELFSRHGRLQFQELEQESEQLAQLSEKQNEVLRRSLSANPQNRHSNAVELLTELRDSGAEIVAGEKAIGPELIDYEKSLDDLKQNAQEQNSKYEETIQKLTADAEIERQEHAETLSQTQNQAREQMERQRADYEQTIAQLRAKITETESQIAVAVNEVNSKAEELALEKEKAVQQSREHEETIQKLTADAERERQEHTETLSQVSNQAREQTEQQRAGYEQTIAQLEEKVEETEAQLTTTVNETNHKVEELASEKERALQQSREYEETIQKLTADAERERQEHAETLSQARNQAREQAEQQRADYEQTIAQFKAKVTETEGQLTAAVNEANHKTEALSSEKKRALRQSMEYEETLEKVRANAKQQQQKSVEQLNQAQWDIETRDEEIKQIRKEAAKVTSRFKLSLIALVPTMILGIVIGHLYVRFDNDIAKQGQVKNEVGRIAQEQTFSELTKEAAGPETSNQRQKAIATDEKALQINKDSQIETAGTLEQIKQLQIESQKWLEPAFDFE